MDVYVYVKESKEAQRTMTQTSSVSLWGVFRTPFIFAEGGAGKRDLNRARLPRIANSNVQFSGKHSAMYVLLQ